jgi:hypothetical protein
LPKEHAEREVFYLAMSLLAELKLDMAVQTEAPVNGYGNKRICVSLCVKLHPEDTMRCSLVSGPRSKNRSAPDINSEEYFPSLSAAKSIEPTGAWGRR